MCEDSAGSQSYWFIIC